MLYKKELSEIPMGDMPKIETKRECIATAHIVELKRSGVVLVADFYSTHDKKLTHRFVSDGKGYLTLTGQSGVWTQQNPRAHYGYCAAECAVEDAQAAADFLNTGKHHWRNDLLGIVDSFINDLRWDRRQRAVDRKEELRKKHFSMYPPLPENLATYCEDHAMPRCYVFLSPLDKKGVRRARCGHCGAEFEAPRAARSGQATSCPVCGKSATYRGTWIKTEIEDKARICIAANVDGSILLRWTNVTRRYEHPEFVPHYDFDDYAYNLHLRTPDGVKTYFYKWQMCGHYYGNYDWYRGRLGDLCYDGTFVYADNLREVFGDRYCNVDLQDGLQNTKGEIAFAILLERLKKIPAAEYLFKLGMTHLAASANSLPGAVNCERPSFSNVLGVDPQFITLYSTANVTMYEHQIIKRYGKWITPEQLEMFRALKIPAGNADLIAGLLQKMSFSRFVHYFTKQKRLNPKRGIQHILVCYRDYLDMSEGLEVDLSHKGIRFPKNCVEAHDQILVRFNQKKDEAEDKRFIKAVAVIYAGLRLTAYEKDGYCIVLPQRRSDLTTEGQSLNHCVGGDGYYMRHIAGDRLIFFVRKAVDRAKPFFTMEVDMKDYRICQLYGFGDCSAPPDVRKFAEAFVRKLAPAKVERKTA